MLKTKTVTLHRVDYHELERYVNEFYGIEKDSLKRGWSFVADMECGNDTSITFGVDGKIDKWEEQELQKFKTDHRKTGWVTGALLNDLCREGLIVQGEYLIDVCW